MADLQGLAEALTKGDRNKVKELTQQALDEGVPPKQILDEGLIAGMEVVGDRFKKNEVYVPEVLIAARAMKTAMEILEPKLTAAGVEPLGTVVIGTVKGDLHDIGKNLVAMMLQGGGFKVVDAGTDVSPEQFVELCTANKAQLCAMSALLTTTMPKMGEIVTALKDAGLGTKSMVGGAPVTQNFAEEIGAEGYAADAASAVDVAKQLVSA